MAANHAYLSFDVLSAVQEAFLTAIMGGRVAAAAALRAAEVIADAAAPGDLDSEPGSGAGRCMHSIVRQHLCIPHDPCYKRPQPLLFAALRLTAIQPPNLKTGTLTPATPSAWQRQKS